MCVCSNGCLNALVEDFFSVNIIANMIGKSMLCTKSLGTFLQLFFAAAALAPGRSANRHKSCQRREKAVLTLELAR